jgi:APA family basic amino acid/polyamine antiporter
VVAGEAIAVGIFLTPAGMAKSLGSPVWLLLVWLVMGTMTLCGALCYGELAARFPQTGGLYVYLREGFGPRLAFLYGWMALLIMDPGVTAALAVGLASYAAYIVPMPAGALPVVALASVGLVAAFNIAATRFGAGFLRWITWLKLGVLAMLVLWALVLRAGDVNNFLPLVERRPGTPPLTEALAGGMVAAFFTFGGWWDVSKISGEVRDPQRTLPRALILGVLAVTAVYILVSATFVYLVPLDQVTSDETFVAQAGEKLFGRTGGQVLSGIVVLCVLGSLAGLLLTAPRVYYAMARDGLFFRSVAELHPRLGTPARAIALQAAMASLLVVLGTFQQILAYFIFSAVLFIGLSVATLFVLPKREPVFLGRSRAVFTLPPTVFLTLLLALLLLILLRSPLPALLGVAVVAAGGFVYPLLRRQTAMAKHA